MAFAIVLPSAGCVGEKKQRTSRSDPASDPMTEESSKDVVVVQNGTTGNSPTNSGGTSSSSKSSGNVFYGTWEKEENGQFRYEIFGIATKSGDNQVGKVTDQANVVVANYTLFKDNTIEIAYLPAFYGGSAFTYKYTVSDGGKTITLDANPKIVYRKGKTDSTIQTDTQKLIGNWLNASNPSDELAFSNANQFDKGWSGSYARLNGGTVYEDGEFTITTAGTVTLKMFGGGAKTYTYSLRNGDRLLDLNRSGSSETYSR